MSFFTIFLKYRIEDIPIVLIYCLGFLAKPYNSITESFSVFSKPNMFKAIQIEVNVVKIACVAFVAKNDFKQMVTTLSAFLWSPVTETSKI